MVGATDGVPASTWAGVVMMLGGVAAAIVALFRTRGDHAAKHRSDEHSTLTAIISTRDTEIGRLIGRVDDLTEKLYSLGVEFGDLKARVKLLEHRNTELEQQIIEKTQEIARLNEALTVESVEHQKTKDRLNQAVADLELMEDERDSARSDLAKLQAQYGLTLPDAPQ